MKYSVSVEERGRLAYDRAAVARAALAWAPAIGDALRVREAKGNEGADIEIHFAGAGDSHCTGDLGLTKVSFDQESRTLRGAVIWIDEAARPDLLQHVVTHEVGHALGLQEHSDDPGDVMFPYTEKDSGVTARDFDTMRMLYFQRPLEYSLGN